LTRRYWVVKSEKICQLNSGDLAAGSRRGRDYEVEVPSCEGRANPGNCREKIGSISGCLRSQSLAPFSLPKQASGAAEYSHSLMLTVENHAATYGTRQAQ
jgi:hypothetical protein